MILVETEVKFDFFAAIFFSCDSNGCYYSLGELDTFSILVDRINTKFFLQLKTSEDWDRKTNKVVH